MRHSSTILHASTSIADDHEEERFCCWRRARRARAFDNYIYRSNRSFWALYGKKYIVTAAINDRNGNSEVTLKLKVFGERKTVNATVDLILVQGYAWRVTSASYVNSNGQTIPLLDPYDTKVQIPRLAA
jgi:hypothetical protein